MFQFQDSFKYHLTRKNALLLLFIVYSSVVFSQNISVQEVRVKLDKAQTDKECAVQIYNTLKENKSNEPKIQALTSSAYAVMCLHVKNPAKKIGFVKQASRKINEVVAANHTLLEPRLIRFAIETKAPKIIGISKHIEEDKAFILKHFVKNELQDIPQKSKLGYYNVLADSKEFSSKELIALHAQIN